MLQLNLKQNIIENKFLFSKNDTKEKENETKKETLKLEKRFKLKFCNML